MKKKANKEKLSFDKIWLLFQETDRKFQETDRKFQETDRKFQETDRILTEKFQEIHKILKESEKKTKKLEELFVGQWGKLVESLVEGSLVKLFNQRNIMVQQTFQRSRSFKTGKEIEIDIIACNGEEIVAVEVKTVLSEQDVKEFIEKLLVFKKAFPQYVDNKVYGAVAFLRANAHADKYAEKKGLFVIKATGDSAKILNNEKFKPVDY